jgi:hypothetical protein
MTPLPKQYVLETYASDSRMFVTVSIPGPPVGFRILDFALPATPETLARVLVDAEAKALSALERPLEEQRFGDEKVLVDASASKSYKDFVGKSVLCTILRTPTVCEIGLDLPTQNRNGFNGEETETLPTDTLTQNLAPRVLELLEEGRHRVMRSPIKTKRKSR